MDEKTNKIFDAVETIRLYIQLGMSYIDAHEDMEGMAPLVMVLDKIQQGIDIIDENYDD